MSAEQVQMILNAMLLLRAFPDHELASEFRHDLEYAREKLPDLYAQAEIRFNESAAREHPEERPPRLLESRTEKTELKF